MCCLTKETVLSISMEFLHAHCIETPIVLTLDFFFVMKVVHELDSPASDR